MFEFVRFLQTRSRPNNYASLLYFLALYFQLFYIQGLERSNYLKVKCDSRMKQKVKSPVHTRCGSHLETTVLEHFQKPRHLSTP